MDHASGDGFDLTGDTRFGRLFSERPALVGNGAATEFF